MARVDDTVILPPEVDLLCAHELSPQEWQIEACDAEAGEVATGKEGVDAQSVLAERGLVRYVRVGDPVNSGRIRWDRNAGVHAFADEVLASVWVEPEDCDFHDAVSGPATCQCSPGR